MLSVDQVCAGATEGEAEGAAGGEVLPGACDGRVRVRQVRNAGGSAEFELLVSSPSEPVAAAALLFVLSNAPVSLPTIVSVACKHKIWEVT